MPSLSKDTAPRAESFGPIADRAGDIEGYTVDFLTFEADVDGTPLYKGLPDDRCQCPHWGYVVAGALTMRFADHEETYGTGEAFYVPPGHVPVASRPGTEIVLFSPEEQLRATEEAMLRNMQTA
jgi:hypothetical protein